jgi:hypothetical protein
MQGSPTLSTHSSSVALTSPSKRDGSATNQRREGGGGKKKRKVGDRSSTSSVASPGTSTSAVQLAKNLDQGVIVYEKGRYRQRRLGSIQRQTTEDAMTTSYWAKPVTGNTSGLVRLYMDTVQEGLHYKAFLVSAVTSAGELVEKALERAHITNNPLHYCIWQVATASSGPSRVLTTSDCPLALQLDWPQFNSYHFQLRLKESINRVQFLLDLPLVLRMK